MIRLTVELSNFTILGTFFVVSAFFDEAFISQRRFFVRHDVMPSRKLRKNFD